MLDQRRDRGEGVNGAENWRKGSQQKPGLRALWVLLRSGRGRVVAQCGVNWGRGSGDATREAMEGTGSVGM